MKVNAKDRFAHLFDVRLDGNPVDCCLSADDESGFVELIVRDRNGREMLKPNGDPLKATTYGSVELIYNGAPKTAAEGRVTAATEACRPTVGPAADTGEPVAAGSGTAHEWPEAGLGSPGERTVDFVRDYLREVRQASAAGGGKRRALGDEIMQTLLESGKPAIALQIVAGRGGCTCPSCVAELEQVVVEAADAAVAGFLDNKPKDKEAAGPPSMDAYQSKAVRFGNPQLSRDMQLSNAGLGLAGEAGECADLIKKHLCHGHALDVDKLSNEIGDVLWYAAFAANLLGKNLSTIAAENIKKLNARYPDGAFSTEASINRKDKSGS